MSSKRYPEEFRIEAVKQVVDRGHSVADVAKRLDITTYSLYAWIKKYGPDKQQHNDLADAQAEIKRLQKELKRATEERDILKKAAFLYFSGVWQGELSILQLSLQSGEISPLSYVKVPGRMTVRLGAQPELVYTQYNSEEQLYRVKVGKEPILLPQTLGRELYPEYAAASDRLLFMSSRSGRFELWYSDLAQQHVQQVSLSDDGAADIASLSPDGTQFVVWSSADGGRAAQLLLGSLTDGSLRPVSSQPFESQHASWSHDSRNLFFSSNVSGDWQIWKLDLQSGISQQHTTNGGIFAREAPDGSLLYVKSLVGGIWQQLSDGREQLLIDDLSVMDWGNWLVDEHGIYYLRRQADADIWLFRSWGSNQFIELFRLPGRSIKAGRSITAVSSDEFVISMYGRREANLMAVPLIAQ